MRWRLLPFSFEPEIGRICLGRIHRFYDSGNFKRSLYPGKDLGNRVPILVHQIHDQTMPSLGQTDEGVRLLLFQEGADPVELDANPVLILAQGGMMEAKSNHTFPSASG